MKLSTRAKYGLRICFLLALNDSVTSITKLVNQTNLSEKYLEQILSLLKRGGLVNAKRGVNGGYELSKPAKEISIDQILTALKDNFEFSDCVKGECGDEYCPNRRFLLGLYSQINGILTNTTLNDLLTDIQCV